MVVSENYCQNVSVLHTCVFGQRCAAALRTALSAAARPDAKADASVARQRLVARRLRIELPCAAHDAGGDWLEGVASAARVVGALREERPYGSAVQI